MDWLAYANKIVDTGLDVIRFLEKLNDSLKDLSDEDRAKKILQILTELIGDALSTENKKLTDTICTELGISAETLKKFRNLWNELEEIGLTRLIQPIDAQSGEIKWPLVTAEADLKPKVDAFILGIEALAKLAAEVETFPKDQSLPEYLPFKAEQGNTLVRIGFDGLIRSAASAKLSGKAFGAEFSAGFEGKAEMDYFFQNSSSSWLISALAADFPQLQNPFTLSDWKDPKTTTLQAISFKASGNMDFGAGIKFGHSWATDLISGGQVSLGIDFGIKAEFDVKLQGDFHLIISRIKEDLFKVRLERSSHSKRSTALSLGVDVNLSGLDSIAAPIANEFLKDAKGIIDKLGEYGDIKKLLQPKLTEMLTGVLEDQDLAATIAKIIGTEQTAEDYCTKLAEGYLDRYSELFFDTAQQEADDLANSLLVALPIPDFLYGKLKTKIDKWIKTQIEDIQKKIENKVKALMKEGAGEVFRPLNVLEEKIDKFIAAGQENVDSILNILFKYLRKYQEIRKKIFTAIKGASELKLTAAIAKKLTREKQKDFQLEFELDSSREKLLAQMVLGRFSDAIRLASEPGSGITLTEGQFSIHDLTTNALDISIKGWGLDFSSQKLMTTAIDATWDISGNVEVGVKGAVTEVKKRANEERKAKFLSDLQFAGSLKQNKLLALGATASYKDQKLHAGELENFLQPILSARLLSQEGKNQALARFQEVRSESKTTSAEIGVALTLTSQDIARLLNQTPDVLRKTFMKNRIEFIYGTHHSRAEQFMKHWGPTASSAFREINKHTEPQLNALWDYLRKRNRTYWYVVFLAYRTVYKSRCFAEAIMKLRELAESEPNQENIEELRKLQNKINKKIDEVIETQKDKGIITGWETLILIKTLAELTKAENTPLVIKWTDVETKPEVFV